MPGLPGSGAAGRTSPASRGAAERVAELLRARERASDASRPEVVERRHRDGFLMARERIDRLLDAGSGIEVGPLAGYSARDGWRPTRGGVDFIGTVHGRPVVTSSTDFTDHGGGYGADRIPRILALAAEHRWPAVLFVDGGGSKPPDTDAAPDTIAVNGSLGPFHYFDGVAELSGLVPTIAIVSGPSFAGHASFAGGANFVIATRGSSIGMAGPPFVRAALGVRLSPHELGGVEMHDATGGIELLVDEEEQAIAAARQLLSYLGDGPTAEPSQSCTDDLVSNVADGRYDMRDVIGGLADGGSTLELRRNWATSVITALARIGGRSVGLLASQPASGDSAVEGGAIDADAADKISRFVELCDFLRIKDALRRRGENISSFEVEGVVNEHPTVLESAVVAAASDLNEDEIKVVIVPRDGQVINPVELTEFLIARLPYFMVPRYVEFVGALPKTPTQKVIKHVLRDRGVTGNVWDREAAGIILRRDGRHAS